MKTLPITKQNHSGRKSPAPKNGQKALDCSVPIDCDSHQRISLCDGEFVILFKTGNNCYHGHVRQWKDLTDQMKNILCENKWTRRNGKIIK